MMRIHKTDTIALKKTMVENEIDTIIQLSGKTGINRNTLSQILNGDVQPSADAMDKLVSALMISPEKAGRIFFGKHLRKT
ncbi:helix-turn-helix domain-containing protein [Paenibacillus radicis (ex Xue et al. 2023)]|uniref:Helix-turn-helix domain-containing protein n=1 Tax=Paenibacillus radicis (ex Xue et al. 2023) TaxID=2972489 RepID=A0ABT1YTX6_9BACL|nr:helix-turn-helix transcriptional regulator [Paenibacillus radicis (ex Xue et al. 2023)]MCR8635774.1 helix-turn-helix domain-containing protein [Paenibacillus radicis (ex Xue et al. 2023)]